MFNILNALNQQYAYLGNILLIFTFFSIFKLIDYERERETDQT